MAKVDSKIPLHQKLILIFGLAVICILFVWLIPSFSVILSAIAVGSVLIVLQTIMILRDQS